MSELHEGLKSLGKGAVPAPTDRPSPELLERFPNPAARASENPAAAAMALRIDVPEFTTLCPLTGQPDWARIVIRYQPDAWCVESKSLKLYLGSFRNAGEFHEACVNRICNDLVRLLDPAWLVVEGRFTPRGGIPFWPVSVFRRELRDAAVVDAERDRLEQPGLFDELEPLTERLDRASRREDVI
jgi:7-cyano-7-deazaguanine reductase